jgi:hypothetical protein
LIIHSVWPLGSRIPIAGQPHGSNRSPRSGWTSASTLIATALALIHATTAGSRKVSCMSRHAVQPSMPTSTTISRFSARARWNAAGRQGCHAIPSGRLAVAGCGVQALAIAARAISA